LRRILPYSNHAHACSGVIASKASIVLAASSNRRSWNWIRARTKRSSVLDGQHWTAAAATVSASAYRRLSSKKPASARRAAGRCGSAAIASRSRFSASTLYAGALTLAETDWVSRYRTFSCKQAARASRGAAMCGDSAIDFRNNSSSSIHWRGDALGPAARRSSRGTPKVAMTALRSSAVRFSLCLCASISYPTRENEHLRDVRLSILY
jgi:hypothetical protein